MGMAVDIVAVGVDMRVVRRCRWRESLRKPAEHAREVQKAEENEHQADGKFHGKADSFRDNPSEKHDRGTNKEDRDRVTEPPERSDRGRGLDAALAADDRGHGDDVICIGGMTHAQKETEDNDGNERQHA